MGQSSEINPPCRQTRTADIGRKEPGGGIFGLFLWIARLRGALTPMLEVRKCFIG
jgi:hypothetical protein